MEAPTCPSCHKPIQQILDLSYGYWEWDGTGYKHRTTTAAVAAVPFTCGACLSELPSVHPQDFPPARDRKVASGTGTGH